jgi:hypothetical protein
MIKALPILVAFALVGGAGVVHGLWTSRWHQSEDLQAALARVPKVPMTVGEWKARELEVSAEEFARAGALAYWSRRYERKLPGKGVQAVNVILMCGPSGRMAVHTPEVCYAGTGYEMVGSADPLELRVPGGESAEFWTARFRKETPGQAGQLRLLWSWGADGAWQAPERPRFVFAGRPALYKLYVLREGTGKDAPGSLDPSALFLTRFLPELNRTLFPADDSRPEL